MTENYYISELMLARIMQERGIRPSLHRIAVLTHIANSHVHPSADTIFSDLSKNFPSLSRTTVYNSLHLLVEKELVKELDIESETRHYDFALQPEHSHFSCRICGKIFDTDLPDGIENTVIPGFDIDSINITFRGTCPECKKLKQ